MLYIYCRNIKLDPQDRKLVLSRCWYAYAVVEEN